jgi:hypothetical protein
LSPTTMICKPPPKPTLAILVNLQNTISFKLRKICDARVSETGFVARTGFGV